MIIVNKQRYILAALTTMVCSWAVFAVGDDLQLVQEQSPWPLSVATLSGVEGIAVIDTGFSSGVMFDSPSINPESDGHRKAIARIDTGFGKREVTDWGQVPFVLDSSNLAGVTAIQTDLAPLRSLLHRAEFVAGMECLHRRTLSFDANIRNVRVETEVKSVLAGERLPLLWNRAKCPMVTIQLPVLGSMNVVVDTGSNETIALIRERVETLMRMGHALSVEHPAKVSDILGNVHTAGKQYVIRRLVLANTVFVNVPVEIGEHQHLGTGLLRYFHVVLDFSNNCVRLRLAETHQVPIHVPPRASGMLCRPIGADQIEVAEIQIGAADESGLKANDIIHSINGQPVSKYSYWDRVDVFSQAGTTLKLAIERDGEHREVALKLRYDFAYPPEWPPEVPEFNPD